MTLASTKKSSAEEEEEVQRVVLASIGEMMAERIHDGGIGAFPTEDEDADGYYVVDWKSAPYTLQDAVELKEYTPAMRLEAGELVVDAEYRNKVARAQGWYTKPTKPLKTKVRVHQVVAPDLKLAPISAQNKLPNTCDKKNATKLKAEKLSNADHEAIMEEIRRRDVLEYEEEEQEDEESEEESGDEDNDGEDED